MLFQGLDIYMPQSQKMKIISVREMQCVTAKAKYFHWTSKAPIIRQRYSSCSRTVESSQRIQRTHIQQLLSSRQNYPIFSICKQKINQQNIQWLENQNTPQRQCCKGLDPKYQLVEGNGAFNRWGLVAKSFLKKTLEP